MSAVDVDLLDVRGLKVDLFSPQGVIHAVRGLDLELQSGESVAIVGESGSGKSVTAKAILGLMDIPSARVSGELLFEGDDVFTMDRAALKAVRGSGISLVFQDALTSLDPVMSIGRQIVEVLRERVGMSKRQAKERAIELLTLVGIDDAASKYTSYPHEFSGGMRQRVCIALAISTNPRVLICDEPTTSLDVTVQSEILELIAELQRRTGMALLFITHDLTVAKRVAERVVVMYAGEIVESGRIDDIFASPRHPYTRALLKSHPSSVTNWRELEPIAGAPVDTRWEGESCSFAPRCPMARERCLLVAPALREVEPGRLSRCHFAEEMAGDRG